MAELRRLPDGSTTSLTADQLAMPKLRIGQVAGFAAGGLVPHGLKDPSQLSELVSAIQSARPGDDERAANFKEWFGDSKVVDDHGRPKTVYHGTSHGGFEHFDPQRRDDHALYGPGYYFTEDPQIGSEYSEKGRQYSLDRPLTPKDLKKAERWFRSKQVEREAREDIGTREHYARLWKSFQAGPEEFAKHLANREDSSQTLLTKLGLKQVGGDNPAVMPVHLRITNPFDMGAMLTPEALRAIQKANADGEHDVTTVSPNAENVYYALSRTAGRAKANEILRAAGYDGITHKGGGSPDNGFQKHNVHIAFEPTQIKSAIGNRGTYSKTDSRIGFANGGKVPSLSDVTKAVSRKITKEDLRSFLKPGVQAKPEAPSSPIAAAPAPKLSPVVADMLIQSLKYPYNDMPSIAKSLKQLGHIAFPKQVAGGFANANPTWQREDVGTETRFHPPAVKAGTGAIAPPAASPQTLPIVQPPRPPSSHESPAVPAMPPPSEVISSVSQASKQPEDLIDKHHGPRSLWDTMIRAGASDHYRGINQQVSHVRVSEKRQRLKAGRTAATHAEDNEPDSPFVERLTKSITKYLTAFGGGGSSGTTPDAPSSPSAPAPVPSPTQPSSGAQQAPRPLTDIISGLVTSAIAKKQAEFLLSPPPSSSQQSPAAANPVSIVPQTPPKLSDVVATMRSEARSTLTARSPRGKSLWQTMGQQPAGFAAGGHVGSIRPPSPEDTVPAMLKPNEVVLNEEQQQKLGHAVGAPASKVFQKIGVPGFAAGGKVPEAGGLSPAGTTRTPFPPIGHDGASALAPQGFAWGGVVKGAMKVAQFGAAVAGGMARDSQPGTVGGMANTVGRGVMSAMTGDIGGVVEALKDLKRQLVQFKDNTIQVNQSLAKYNATLALAYANLNIGRISRDIRMASATGETASRLVGNQNKLENEQLGVGIKLANTKNSASSLIASDQRFGNMALEGGMNLAGGAVNGVSRTLGLGEATKWLEKIAMFTEQTADATRQFAEENGFVDKGAPQDAQLPGLIEAAFQLQPWNQQAARDRVLKPFQ